MPDAVVTIHRLFCYRGSHVRVDRPSIAWCCVGNSPMMECVEFMDTKMGEPTGEAECHFGRIWDRQPGPGRQEGLRGSASPPEPNPTGASQSHPHCRTLGSGSARSNFSPLPTSACLTNWATCKHPFHRFQSTQHSRRKGYFFILYFSLLEASRKQANKRLPSSPMGSFLQNDCRFATLRIVLDRWCGHHLTSTYQAFPYLLCIAFHS